jgi:hypothetical protein
MVLWGSCLCISIWYWWDECFGVIYNFPDLGLKRLGGVSCCGHMKLFARMKSVILESYCLMGKITRVFPLSACVTMASFSLSFVFMFFIILASG